MTEPDIELVDDEEGISVMLRGKAAVFFTDTAAARGVSVEQLVSGILWDAIRDGRL